MQVVILAKGYAFARLKMCFVSDLTFCPPILMIVDADRAIQCMHLPNDSIQRLLV